MKLFQNVVNLCNLEKYETEQYDALKKCYKLNEALSASLKKHKAKKLKLPLAVNKFIPIETCSILNYQSKEYVSKVKQKCLQLDSTKLWNKLTIINDDILNFVNINIKDYQNIHIPTYSYQNNQSSCLFGNSTLSQGLLNIANTEKSCIKSRSKPVNITPLYENDDTKTVRVEKVIKTILDLHRMMPDTVMNKFDITINLSGVFKGRYSRLNVPYYTVLGKYCSGTTDIIEFILKRTTKLELDTSVVDSYRGSEFSDFLFKHPNLKSLTYNCSSNFDTNNNNLKFLRYDRDVNQLAFATSASNRTLAMEIDQTFNPRGVLTKTPPKELTNFIHKLTTLNLFCKKSQKGLNSDQIMLLTNNCKNLKSLSIVGNEVRSFNGKSISKLKHLECLELEDCDIDRNFAEFINHFNHKDNVQKITKIALSFKYRRLGLVPDDVLLASLKRLISSNILKHCKEFKFRSCGIDNDILELILRNGNVKVLELLHEKVSDTAFENYVNEVIYDASISRNGMRQLKIKKLYLVDCGVEKIGNKSSWLNTKTIKSIFPDLNLLAFQTSPKNIIRYRRYRSDDRTSHRELYVSYPQSHKLVTETGKRFLRKLAKDNPKLDIWGADGIGRVQPYKNNYVPNGHLD